MWGRMFPLRHPRRGPDCFEKGARSVARGSETTPYVFPPDTAVTSTEFYATHTFRIDI